MRVCHLKSILLGFIFVSFSAIADLAGVQLVSGNVTVTSPASHSIWTTQTKDTASLITLGSVNPFEGALPLGGHLTANGIVMLLNKAQILFSSGAMTDIDGLMLLTDDMLGQLNSGKYLQTRIKRGIPPSLIAQDLECTYIVEGAKPMASLNDYREWKPVMTKEVVGHALNHTLAMRVLSEPHAEIVLAANVILSAVTGQVFNVSNRILHSSDIIHIQPSNLTQSISSTNASIATLPTLGHQNMSNSP